MDERTKVKVCPRCGREYTGYPALSRVDNLTHICPDCGMAEAMEALNRYNIQRLKEATNGKR